MVAMAGHAGRRSSDRSSWLGGQLKVGQTMSIEEEYADVLQNVEAAIVAAFEADPTLTDRDALAAMKALLDGYSREMSGRAAKAPSLPARARIVYEACRRMCEWRLGRQPLSEGDPHEEDAGPDELSVAEIVLCLKRLRKSIRFWHAENGPRGYLRFVSGFLGDADA